MISNHAVGMPSLEIKSEPRGDYCTAALVTIAQIWKQPPRPSTGEGWMSTKLGYIHSMEYYSSLKTKEILPFATTGINLEDIILSEISRSHRIKYYMIPLRWVSKFATHIETEGKPGWLWRIERRRKWSYINRQFSSCELWLESTGGCLWFLGNQVVPALILTLNRTH